jgi:hypothetical protein
MSKLELDLGQQQEIYKEKPYLAGLHNLREKYPQVDGLLKQLENFDHFTFQHSLRAEAFAWNLATELGFEEEDRRTFCLAAVLHDVGKEVLDKQMLNDPHFDPKKDLDKMKPHVIASFKKVYSICPEAAEIILRHHSFQRYSYPSDEEINRYSKIDDPVELSKIEKMSELLSMIDVFETRSGHRPGKDPEPAKKFLPDMHKQFRSRGDDRSLRILMKTLGKEKIIKRLHPNITNNLNLYLKHPIQPLPEISETVERK